MIYFVQDKYSGGPIKIGYSVNPKNRLIALQTAYPYELALIGSIEGSLADEAEWHDVLGYHRLSGEWFAPSKRVIEKIVDALESEPDRRTDMLNTYLRYKSISSSALSCGA